MASRASKQRRAKTPARAQLVKNASVPAEVAAAIQLAGMTGRAFNPGQPLRPFDGYSTSPRSHDFPVGVNITTRPRLNERTSFDLLRGLIDAYDFAQICIWHKINSIRSLKWSLVPLPHAQGDIDEMIAYATRLLKKPDRKHTFATVISKYLYDTFAYDAGALYKLRNNAGRVIGFKHVDGTTLAPLMDDWGDRPDTPAPAYVQFYQGVPQIWLTEDDIVYEPFRPSTTSPYGRAPIESVILNANTDLRFQTYFMQRFTDGNVPEAFAGSPEGWTPTQIEEFQASWDALLYGDQTQKHQIKWVPNGTTFAWSNEKEFSDKFSVFMAQKTMAAFDIVPSDLGFVADVNRATSETQADVQFRVGDLPGIEHVQNVIDSILQEDMGLPLEFQYDTGQEVEDRLATAQADEIYVNIGAISSSEVRERVYGLAEPEGQTVPRYIFTTRGGPIPLSALFAVSGQIDSESGAPLPGAELSKKPFAPIEGVVPNPPPPMPSLALQTFGDQGGPLPDTLTPVVSPAPLALPAGTPSIASPLVKEGISAATGLQGSPLLDSEPIDDEPIDEDLRVEKSTELTSYRRFVKARRRSREWRDFTFTVIDTAEAHRLNQAGRAEIRKAAGELIAAGLCVRGADTGRVLMIQRGLDPADPASGMWEFPGGCLEDGESSLQAAWREWQEETGCLIPAGTTVGSTWAAANGIYEGLIASVSSEATVPIGVRGQVTNPDDPDGDIVEALAWWDPSLLMGNPAVRNELAADLPAVLEALEPSMLAKSADGDPRWHAAPVRKVEEKLVVHHADGILDALSGAASKDQLKALAAAYVASRTK
jgi:8-oxo-dGTP pyrophosphatase MutT (NUDIX family)